MNIVQIGFYVWTAFALAMIFLLLKGIGKRIELSSKKIGLNEIKTELSKIG